MVKDQNGKKVDGIPVVLCNWCDKHATHIWWDHGWREAGCNAHWLQWGLPDARERAEAQ